MLKIATSARIALKSSLEPGYYLYDTVDGQPYMEAGRFNSLDDILKVDTDNYYHDPDNTGDFENTLGIFCVHGDGDVYIYSRDNGKYRRASRAALAEASTHIADDLMQGWRAARVYAKTADGQTVDVLHDADLSSGPQATAAISTVLASGDYGHLDGSRVFADVTMNDGSQEKFEYNQDDNSLHWVRNFNDLSHLDGDVHRSSADHTAASDFSYKTPSKVQAIIDKAKELIAKEVGADHSQVEVKFTVQDKHQKEGDGKKASAADYTPAPRGIYAIMAATQDAVEKAGYPSGVFLNMNNELMALLKKYL